MLYNVFDFMKERSHQAHVKSKATLGGCWVWTFQILYSVGCQDRKSLVFMSVCSDSGEDEYTHEYSYSLGLISLGGYSFTIITLYQDPRLGNGLLRCIPCNILL